MTAWLLTWLWQGVALAVALSVALHMLPRVNAATRYVLWWGAFAALAFLGWQSLPAVAPAGPIAAAAAIAGAASEPALVIQVRPLPAWALSAIAMLWASVSLFRLLRIFPGLNALYQLKDECRPFPRAVEAQLPFWLERTGRRVRLVLCDSLSGAAVLGLHAPCIALPSSLVGELSAPDLDQIILHEYGHVQRRDDWMRLVQALLEAALWIHPATFMIGRELNLEREVACDDWVIARTGSPKRYAGCLSRVAERRRLRVPAAFAQALFGGNRDLVRRVDRLLDANRNTRRNPSRPAIAFGAMAMAACAIQLRAFPLVTDIATVASPEVASGFSRTTTEPTTVASGFSRTVADPTLPLASGFPPSLQASADRRSLGAAGSRTRTEISRPANVARQVDETSQVRLTADATVIEEPPVLRTTRTFEGVYQTPNRTADPAAPAPLTTPWQVAADAGVGIGSAAHKASVGLANTLTKAGTAFARSF